jgi:predicted phage-related endonuclease
MASSEAMLWGQRLEVVVAQTFADANRLDLFHAGLLRSIRWPRMLATPDRLTSDGGGLEVKSTGFFAGKQLADGGMPREWFWQMVHYLAVTGCSHWWLAALVGGQRLEVRRIDADDVTSEMNRAAEAVERFWADHVLTDVPPPSGDPFLPEVEIGRRVEAALPDAVLADAARWRALLMEGLDADAEIAEIKARLIAQLGTDQLLTVGGRPVVRMVTRKGASRFDRAGLRAAHPELEKQFSTIGAPARC